MSAIPQGRVRPTPAQTGRPPTAVHETAVFGTAQPPRGLSGVMRRRAYEIPEHHVRHWLLLMLADRIDLLEHRAHAIGTPLAIAVVVTGILAGIGAVRLWRGARR